MKMNDRRWVDEEDSCMYAAVSGFERMRKK